MFFDEYNRVEITDFLGPFTSLEEGDVPAKRGLLARNVRYSPGNVTTRFGFGTALNPNEAVRSMFNWVYSDPSLGPRNYLLYWDGTNGRLRYTSLDSVLYGTGYSLAGVYAASFANAGAKVIIAHFGANGLGVGHGRVFASTFLGTATDTLFARPFLATEVTATGSAIAGGDCTPGTRRVGFIGTTRAGYTGRPSPCDAGLVLEPISITTDATNKTARLTVSPVGTWPQSAASVQMIATTTDNLAQYYFVPGAMRFTPGTSTFTAVLDLNISDVALELTGTPANGSGPYFNLLTQDSGGNPPFSPSSVVEYGNRIVYIVSSNSLYGQCYFVSEPNNYEAITGDQHIRYLPGQRQVVAAFAIRNVLYLLGPNWTYADSDNGDLPATWSAQALVDGTIGTSSPTGFAINPSTGTGWVAHTTGLYRFDGGAYDKLPISYYQADQWQRINWAYGHTLQVVDDSLNKRVIVIAPLDAATSPSHMLVWDYTAGTTAEAVKFSLDDKQDFAPCSIAIVQNPTSRMLEVWVGPPTAGVIQRQMRASDTNPYRDGASAINSIYETAQFPGSGGSGELYFHAGAHLRAYGNGTAGLTAYDLDKKLAFALADLTGLVPNPGKEHLRLIPSAPIAEGMRLRIDNKNTADNWFSLSRVKWYFTEFAAQR